MNYCHGMSCDPKHLSWIGCSCAHPAWISSLRLWFNTLSKTFIYLFIYFWLHWVFVAVHGLSLAGETRGCSSLQCRLLLQSTGSRPSDFSTCNLWAQKLWHTGLVAPQHVGSPWTRDRTHVPCIGRRVLICWNSQHVFNKHFLWAWHIDHRHLETICSGSLDSKKGLSKVRIYKWTCCCMYTLISETDQIDRLSLSKEARCSQL